jgi:DNA-directed RNA polymerase specialized sigma24 family protein
MTARPFGEFYDRHAKAVLGELRRRGLSTEQALDMAAEVFATALLASRRYRPGEAPARAWLLGIAGNKLAHRRRRAAIETAARRKLGMPRLTYSDDALERVEELLDAQARLYTNGAAALPPASATPWSLASSRNATTTRSRPRPARVPPPSASA